MTEASSTNERTYQLSFSEGTLKVEVLMGNITKERTDVIVNSVHGNLDLSASTYVFTLDHLCIN